jgi:TonB family protein
MRTSLLLSVLVFTLSALGDPTPYTVAKLVGEDDSAVLADSLTEALASPDALVRAAAARVIAVRNVDALLPRLGELVRNEADASAAREEIRTLALIGGEEDLRLAVQAASKWPPGMDNALALAVARRGGMAALDVYASLLRPTRMSNFAEFFRVALWGRAQLLPITGSRLVSAADERGWRGLLAALAQSDVAMHGPVLAASLDSRSEDIRAASVWFVVNGYAMDPESVPDAVRAALAGPRPELSSDREDFGRELLLRMLGGEKKDDPRWQRFLESDESDQLLTATSEALQYLTDREYALRYARCEVQSRDCAIPRKRGGRTIPSQIVTPPAFDLPAVLPAGLADAILKGAGCKTEWVGVAGVTVDSSGRVLAADVKDVDARPSCRSALETLLRVSFATNASIQSSFSGSILLARGNRAPVCLDEDAPDEIMTSTFRIRPGGDVQPPQVAKRVEPDFPESARKALAGRKNVYVVAQAVISKYGCVRSIRLIEQSPFPSLNGAAVTAVSEWKVRPAYYEGEPVDVQFNLTINFTTR